jgi:glycosyltransferase involved in cell wall biosynthesis
VRLGVYTDTLYRHDGATLTNSRAFTRFVTSLPPRVDEVVLFGRVAPEPGRADYPLPTEGVRFVALPHYPRVRSIGAMLRAARGSARAFGGELGGLDAVWVFGPHPMALLFASMARRRGVPLVLGVRQDYPAYIANRLPGRAWRWAVPAAALLDRAFRRLARRAPAIVVGDDLARRYRRGAPVLATGFSLVGAADVVDGATATGRDWSGRIGLLSVGRLDPEKNPLLLVDVMSELESREPGRWRLTVVGDGPLRGELADAAAARGLADAIELVGEVTNGAELWEHYRRSHSFLHVSLTEGVPQVLFEAAAAGLPVVATSVGGVADALRGGELGLLVAPRDANAAVEALLLLRDDAALREGLIRAGLRNARAETMEAQLDRIAAFLRASLGDSAPMATVAPPSASSSQR